MSSIGDALQVVIGADADPLIRGLKAAEGALNQFNKNASRAFDTVSAAAEGMNELMGVAVTGGLAYLLKRTLETTEALKNQADALGLNVEKFQLLSLMAQQNGVDAESMNTALARLSAKLGEAAANVGSASLSFQRWQISIRDSNGNIRQLDDVLYSVANRIKSIADPTLRAAMMQELFGKNSLALVNMLRDGAEGMRAMEDRAKSLGSILSQDLVEKGKEANEQLDLMGKVLSTKLSAAILDVLPNLKSLTSVLDALNYATHGFNNLMEGLKPTSDRSMERLVDDLTRINAEISDLREQLAKPVLNNGGLDKAVRQKYTEPRLAELEYQRNYIYSLMDEKSKQLPRIDIPAGKTASISGGFMPGNPEATRALDNYLKKLQQQHDLASLTERDAYIQKALIEAESIARTQNIKLTDDYIEKVKEASAANYDQAEAIKNIKQASQEMSSAFTSNAMDILDGTKSITDGFLNLAKTLEQVFLKAALTKPLENFLSNSFGGSDGGGIFSALFGGYRASGGPVSAGVPYVVGERGPEFFVPNNSGTIIPNNALGGRGNGGGISMTWNISVSGAAASDPKAAAQNGLAFAKAAEAGILDIIRKQQRPGGVLNP